MCSFTTAFLFYFSVLKSRVSHTLEHHFAGYSSELQGAVLAQRRTEPTILSECLLARFFKGIKSNCIHPKVPFPPETTWVHWRLVAVSTLLLQLIKESNFTSRLEARRLFTRCLRKKGGGNHSKLGSWLPHIKNPRRVSMGRKVKVNVVAAAAAAQRTTNFFQTWVNFWFYSIISHDAYWKKPTVAVLVSRCVFL